VVGGVCFGALLSGTFFSFLNFASTTLLWHGTFTINSLAHVFGSRRFITTDTSKNNLFLSILTMGEGWHNNHHAWMTSVKAGLVW
jgi:stearoyl-CoA desaturase (delta-9 desaturase)